MQCTGPYSLQVTGRSVLDFSYQLTTVHDTETAQTKRLLGSPVKGNAPSLPENCLWFGYLTFFVSVSFEFLLL